MPELPEVETTLQGIKPFMLNKQLDMVDIFTPKLRYPIPEEIPFLFQKTTITAMEREAKYILLHANNNHSLILHLGMSGRLTAAKAGAPREKHDHVVFTHAEYSIRFNDPRRFGLLLTCPTHKLNTHPLLCRLGVEPLEPNFNADYLLTYCRQKTSPIKTVIMNQACVVGVGNIYANEALHLARICPSLPAGKLSGKQAENLVIHIKGILKKAIAAGGTTLRDYKNVDGTRGYFYYNFSVYNRAEQPCLTCGETIHKYILGQRATYVCPACQPGT